MSSFISRKALLIVGALSLTAGLVFYFSTVNSRRSQVATVNPAFGEHITSYTAGVISSGSTIRIVLAEDAIKAGETGETSVKLFDFSPSVSGTTVWLDTRTVEFRPAARLASGRVYEVTFNLGRLVPSVPRDLQEFEYTFQVMPQNYEVSVDNVRPYVKTELKRQRIEGTLLTADFAEQKAVEQVLVARQEARTLALTWTHTSDGRQHHFVVEEVSRTEQPGKVQLQLNGSSIDVNTSNTVEVEIPSLSDFKVTNVRVEQGGNQHVVIQFSDPLDEKQNVAGLISMAEAGTLDFEIRDNEIHVFPPVRQNGTRTLTLNPGIRNVLSYALTQGQSLDVVFEQLSPAVRFTGKGSILPGTDGLVLPFEAVNLRAVDVEVLKVFESNILQFLQVNSLDGNEELRRTGRPVLHKTLALDNAGVTDLGKWNRFTLDLSKLISTDPGAIYYVRLRFKRAYSVYACDGQAVDNTEESTTDESWSEGEAEESSWDSFEEYYYTPGFDWEQRDNPCHVSYYTSSRFVGRNIISSDLGIMAKRGGDGNTHIFVNDLRTTSPLSGVQVDVLDYQQQVLGTASTGADGKVVISSAQVPFFVVARNGNQRGYLRLQNGESLSVSNFDVGGEQVRKGLKGFLYGERGVWRPGDSLFLTFMLEDKLKLLPPAHPVVLELQNPQGQVTQRLVRSAGENGFYSFATATAPDAPTGNWTARVKVGGTEFTQPVRIEMVKPNRLKINLDFGTEKIVAGNGDLSGKLLVNWLHGAPGKNLKASFELTLTKGETKFARYPEFVFDDPGRNFTSETREVFEGFTDATGNAAVNVALPDAADAPGVLNAVFRGKVFEESGNFSVDRFSIPYYPYVSFTGIRLPQGDKARGMLLTDTTHRVDVVSLDAEGNPLSREGIQMTITKLDWRWWWDTSDGGANYVTSEVSNVVASGVINTRNGKGEWTFKIKYPEWGRYLVRALDPQSGHSTAKVVYIDWPGWAGRARNESSAATMLAFSSDKPTYNIGDKATLVIPGTGQGRALVSLENGSAVVQTFWVETQQGDNRVSFDVTREMTPNIFAHVTLLQPHAQTVNDLPIRLYGVIPVGVEDPQTHLQPVISMPDVLEPGQEVVIKVSEKDRRRMTYTLAMVDEGLLDLTRYRTPDPWNRFYAREGLGVRTWDLYDEVMSSFGGRMERLLAIGGDLAAGKADDSKANRFKPVVKFLGPFTLDGGTAEHRFVMPQYVGSVKTMVVAGDAGAYGRADKATPVRKPLMVLATLPRVLGPEENLQLPVTLFTMDKAIREARVTVKVSGPVSLAEETRTVALTGEETTISFPIKVKGATGTAHFEVTATAGSNKATDVIDLEVRNPNPPVTVVTQAMTEAGKSWSAGLTPVGLPGTNATMLEISALPPINLGQRLQYLLQYPHGCIEQTTSAAFPQLYLEQVKTLTADEKFVVQRNVKAAIERIRHFATPDGGFSYWPGQPQPDAWGTSYAGHFLAEAEAHGYFVPHDLMKKWRKYQKKLTTTWRRTSPNADANDHGYVELDQAYRLYTLALAGESDLAAMNRMREQQLSLTTRWMLAAAYARAGQPEAAKKMIDGAATRVKAYQEMGNDYGSDIRDQAIMLETLVTLGERTKAFEVLKEVAAALGNSNTWMSTQTTAWALKAVSSFASAEKRGELTFDYTWNGKQVSASTEMTFAQIELTGDARSLSVQNRSKGVLYVRVIQQGVPARGTETDGDSNLSMFVNYTDKDGSPIDPSKLEQGTQFVATVTVTHPGVRGAYKNLSLTQIFPSGWEINNLRLTGDEASLGGDRPDYEDIRDDRVNAYFNLGRGQRKVFKVSLTASYAGTYYLPAVVSEAMYDHSIFARRKGQVVEVIKPVVN